MKLVVLSGAKDQLSSAAEAGFNSSAHHFHLSSRTREVSVGIYQPGAVTDYGRRTKDPDTSGRSCGMTI